MTEEKEKKDLLIGGTVCHLTIPATLIDPEARLLSFRERERLWEIFTEIGKAWKNLEDDSLTVRSSWLEFIHAKTMQQPSYAGEYANAIAVIQELERIYGREQAFHKLFFENGIPDGPPTTRVAHAKVYVIDEFIRMQVVAGGFKGFIKPSAKNYKGYVGGSRYNLEPRVRAYEPGESDQKKQRSESCRSTISMYSSDQA